MKNRYKWYAPLIAIACTLVLPRSLTTPEKPYTQELAVFAVFRDEARYLKEWIEFHMIQGVDYFLLYNNFSKDNYKEVLAPYIAQGKVLLKEWPVKNNPHPYWQISAARDALKIAREKAIKWLAIIDSDEFLFCPHCTLPDFLKGYEQFGGVCANWQLFGSSGIKKLPLGSLVIENFIMKALTNYGANNHVKSIVRPERVNNIKNIHFVEYSKGYYQVDENKKKFATFATSNVSIEKIRINHYWSRDEETFRRKLQQKRRLYPGKVEHINYLKRLYDAINTEQDMSILIYLEELKTRMLKPSD